MGRYMDKVSYDLIASDARNLSDEILYKWLMRGKVDDWVTQNNKNIGDRVFAPLTYVTI